MATTPIKTNLPVNRVPVTQTPAQKISTQVVSDAATVMRLFALRTSNTAAFGKKLLDHNSGKPQPEFLAFDRMQRRVKANYIEKVGNVIVSRKMLGASAIRELNAFAPKEPGYRNTLQATEKALWNKQNSAAINAVKDYETALAKYTGSGPAPSRASVDKTIAAIDTNWVYSRGNLNKSSADQKAALTQRANAALKAKTIKGAVPTITEISFKTSTGKFLPAANQYIKPGSYKEIQVSWRDKVINPATTYYHLLDIPWPPSQVIYSTEHGYDAKGRAVTFKITIRPNRLVEVKRA